MTSDLLAKNPGIRAWETVEVVDRVSWEKMPGLPCKPFRADAHLHSFTRAFGLPERRMGVWLREGAVSLPLQVSKVSPGRRKYYLKLTAMLSDWRRYATRCRISMNSQTLFEGNLFVENVCRGWPAIYFRVPDSALREGRNILTIDKGKTDPEQALILHLVELLAYDTGPRFSVAAVPSIVTKGRPFTVVIKTLDMAKTVVSVPPGWTQVGKPFRILNEAGLYGLRLVAGKVGVNQSVRFELGGRRIKAAVGLVADAGRRDEPVLCGIEANDLRHDATAEIRMALKNLLCTDLGNLMVFRPVHGRNFFELADAKEIKLWLRLLENIGARYMNSFHRLQPRGKFREIAGFDRPVSRRFLGEVDHEPYMVLQRQWQTKRFRAARNVAEAAAAYEAFLKSRARRDGLTAIGEPSFLGIYARNVNLSYILCEPVANFTLLTATARGTCRDRTTRWGYHIPPDWYFGWPNDEKKNRRLECALYCGYIAGGHIFYLENAVFGTNANTRMDMEDAYVARNRRILREFHAFTKLHPRRGELDTRFAAVFGNCNSAVWLHDDVIPELLDTVHEGGSGEKCDSNWSESVWGKWPDNGSRRCMRVADAVAPPVPFKSRSRSVLKMFTGTPFGQFDVIQADFEALKEHDLVFYTGFNLMTDALLRPLEAYVKQGGTLLLAGAHLNASRLPKERMAYLRSARSARLIGARFAATAVAEEVRIGAGKASVQVLRIGEISTASVTSRTKSGAPLILENRLGKGKVVLLTAADYRSLELLLGRYKKLVRDHLSRLGCDFGVSGTRKIFSGVYREKDVRTLQLYNTAWDDKRTERFKVVLWGKAHAFALKPCEFAEITACPSGALRAESPFARIEITAHGRGEIRFRFTSPVRTKVQFVAVAGRPSSLINAKGRRVRHDRSGFVLPAGSADEYVLCIGSG